MTSLFYVVLCSNRVFYCVVSFIKDVRVLKYTFKYSLKHSHFKSSHFSNHFYNIRTSGVCRRQERWSVNCNWWFFLSNTCTWSMWESSKIVQNFLLSLSKQNSLCSLCTCSLYQLCTAFNHSSHNQINASPSRDQRLGDWEARTQQGRASRKQ